MVAQSFWRLPTNPKAAEFDSSGGGCIAMQVKCKNSRALSTYIKGYSGGLNYFGAFHYGVFIVYMSLREVKLHNLQLFMIAYPTSFLHLLLTCNCPLKYAKKKLEMA